jgi:hypothetical protein
MTQDDPEGRSLEAEDRIAEIVARCGNIFSKFGLSPPTQLRVACRHWLGLTPDEIVGVVLEHLDRGGYHTGSGDQLFHVLQADLRRAWQAKHPPRDDAPEMLRRKRRGRLRPVPPSGRFAGYPGAVDAFDDRADSDISHEDDRAAPVERPSGLPGYDTAGVSISPEDDEAL